MFRIDVLQNQWIVGALLAGVVLVLAVVLAYMAFWQPRLGPEGEPEERRTRVPWVLIMTYVGVLLLIVTFTWAMAKHPPNW